MTAPCTAYLAAEGFEAELATELGHTITAQYDRLFVTNAAPRPAAWAANIWRQAEILPITSIKDAASQLRAIQRNWACYAFAHHRRAALIEAALPHVSAKPMGFLDPLPTAPLGSWCLIDTNTMIFSADCSSPFKNGNLVFVEDRVNPPSRAYLKLWDYFTLTGHRPQVGDICLDLGASPGGWTWVLAEMGAKVISVDKAPLAPALMDNPNIRFQEGSAFALSPTEIGPVDWLFSDIICYPARLYTLIEKWRAAGTVKNFACTLKFQGETDHETTARFAAIAGSQLQHLPHNKHELMWSLNHCPP